MKKIVASVLALALAASLAACGSSTASSAASSEAASAETTVLKVGASPSPHAEILEQVKPILAEQGIDLQITEFDDYVMPNTAVEDGSLDANYFQHLPYLEDFNAKNGTHLASVGVIHYEPMGCTRARAATWPTSPTARRSASPATTPTAPARCCCWRPRAF